MDPLQLDLRALQVEQGAGLRRGDERRGHAPNDTRHMSPSLFHEDEPNQIAYHLHYYRVNGVYAKRCSWCRGVFFPGVFSRGKSSHCCSPWCAHEWLDDFMVQFGARKL
jgi:hypothetical protein